MFPFKIFLERDTDGPPYTVSQPAALAARNLVRQFNFTERETVDGDHPMPATEKNIAITVDTCTQVFRVSLLLDQLQRSKESVAQNMDLLRWAVRSVKFLHERLPNYGGVKKNLPEAPNGYKISGAGMHTAHVLRQIYEITEKGTIEATDRNIAILVDVHTQIFRIMAALDETVKNVRWTQVDETAFKYGHTALPLEQAKEALHVMDLIRERMPGIGMQVTGPERDAVMQRLVTPQMEAMNEISNRRPDSWAARDQQSVLRQAGLVR